MEPDSTSPSPNENIQPVRFLKTDDRLAHPAPGVALCLSGGGYRAMLFHLGALWRLNDAGLLRGLVRVSSVSGGSITAGVLGLAWKRLQFNDSNIATNLKNYSSILFGSLQMTRLIKVRSRAFFCLAKRSLMKCRCISPTSFRKRNSPRFADRQ
jgi:predicted acylesterase/phospholipase RssA